MSKVYDAIIVGGGASALASAITAKNNNINLKILILEKKDVLGKKLSQTGNGRCNITNVKAEHLETVMNFLSSNGIFLSEEDGRLYPNSFDAKDVVSVLEREVKKLGCEVLLDAEVKHVYKADDESTSFGYNFEIEALVGNDEKEPADSKGLDGGKEFADSKGLGVSKELAESKGLDASKELAGSKNNADTKLLKKFFTKKVIIATGGKSYASFGTTGDGYIFARSLGHNVSKLIPALTGVEVQENIKSLKGVRQKARVALYMNENMLFQEDGEVQFREDSISGICVMNLSRLIRQIDGLSPEDSYRHYRIEMNFIPDINITSENLKDESLTTLVKGPIATLIERKYLSGEERLNEVKNFKLTVKGLKGWNEAQVTSGGVSLNEVDIETMESKLVNNLYFTGEVLDYDGPCGGFNLNFAWYTGILCGKAIAR